MLRRKRSIRAIASLCLLLITAAASAAPPGSLGDIMNVDRTLNTSEQTRVREYVRYWSEQLAGQASTPAEAAEAAQKLIDPTASNIASSIFLSAYSQEAIPRLVQILREDDTFAAVQAAKVMGFLGTPEALEELVNWTSSASEQRTAVRLWAARGCDVLLARTIEAQVLSERQLSSALRQLKQAAEDEEDWLVLHRQFQALAAARNSAARERQLEVFGTITRRLERDNAPSSLMKALTREMVSLRDQYLRISDFQQQLQFGSALAPLLGEVYDVANAHWEMAQQEPEAKQTYGQAIQLSEGLLRLIDRNVRAGQSPPRTDLHSAWSSSDRPRFENEARSWMNVLQGPPYNR